MKNRVAECVRQIQKVKCDSFLISHPAQITYLTGFRNADGYLLLTVDKQMVFFTNFLYQEEAKKCNVWDVVISTGNIFLTIKQKSKALKLKNIGFDAKHLPFLEYRKLNEYLYCDDINFVATSDLIDEIVAIKSPEEIKCMQKAAKISLNAFSYIDEIYDSAMTEKQLSIEIEKFLKINGDNEIAFPSIIASGKNSMYPHHLANDSVLGESFLVDLGAKFQGYCADLTRLFFSDRMPSLYLQIYDIVRKAQEIAIKEVHDGVCACVIDKSVRSYLDSKGFGKYFGHGLGHGIGLSVHEWPFLNSKSEVILREGMVITIEPAIYLTGKYGVRLEEMILVKSDKGELLHGNIDR